MNCPKSRELKLLKKLHEIKKENEKLIKMIYKLLERL